MIKAIFRGKNDKEKTGIVFGLSRENLKRLVKGQPIIVDLRSMGVKQNIQIMLFFGETERDCARQLQEFIGPETDIKQPLKKGDYRL